MKNHQISLHSFDSILICVLYAFYGGAFVITYPLVAAILEKKFDEFMNNKIAHTLRW